MTQDAGGRVTPYEDHLFWLEVLEDHAHFLHDHLAPQEREWVAQAARYRDAFHQAVLHAEALDPHAGAAAETMVRFAQEVEPLVAGYFRLEGRMQSMRLWNQINLNLTPTYFNGTLNENQEYLRQLSFYGRGKEPPELPLTSLLDLWVEDQLGHAVLLRNLLDPVELKLAKQADAFSEGFQAFMIKNRAMQSYERFTPPGFPAEREFAEEVLALVRQFYGFVQLVVGRYRTSRVLTRTTLRFLEHHFPESCYFMRKLAMFLPGTPAIADCPLRKPSFPEGGVQEN